MAGRPRGCHCYSESWAFNPSGYIRCEKCGGAPNKYSQARALTEATAKRHAAVTPPTPKPEAKPEENKEHAKLASAMTAARDKKVEKEAVIEAKQKSRKVGTAKVKSAFPARVGGVVQGSSGQGYIFADELDKVYVVGNGWFGSWDIGDVDFRDPADKDIKKDGAKPDIVITEIVDWNAMASEFLVACREAKRWQSLNGFDVTVGFVNGNIDYLGVIEGMVTGVWTPDSGAKVFSITPSMWGII